MAQWADRSFLRDVQYRTNVNLAIASRIPGCGHVIVTGADHMLPLRAA